MDHWLEFSGQRLCGQPGLNGALAELDKALSLRTFLVGHALTLADISVWAALKGDAPVQNVLPLLGSSGTSPTLCFSAPLQVRRSGRARPSPSPTSVAGSSS